MMNRNLRTRSRLLLALPAAALALSLAACGGGPAERPSAEEVSKGLQTALEDQGVGDALSDSVLLCLSEALVESDDISNDTLAKLASGDKDATGSNDEAAKVTEVVTAAAPDCVTAE